MRTGRVDSDSTEHLFRAAADGDGAAWEALVGRLSPLVWSVIRSYRLIDADAHEVFQTCWFRLADNLGRIKEPDRVGSWLATTARHECLKVIRGSRRVIPTSDLDVLSPGADDRSPERAVLDAEEADGQEALLRSVWEAYERLSENCRRLLRVLMASPPPSYAEVAAGLGIAIGSIGPTRGRCLAHLRKLLAG
ncbi:sigma-70 family RNA polymerase sigma factor [Microbispora triticiradicis]|uniref:Sigma-70 family RNA polymerase sigma factor n=1 Tax=Microbispora triticiradicis TaxID=2200763 RepID=A0ABX9LDQ5_9ACTN|nr:sigma-70 family RNA polymerase sigma factor [Microbispora triticiradicis]RGA02111.1 sigma-70 family RNA polymerase sigma factor [Microbispora triticiradicis]